MRVQQDAIKLHVERKRERGIELYPMPPDARGHQTRDHLGHAAKTASAAVTTDQQTLPQPSGYLQRLHPGRRTKIEYPLASLRSHERAHKLGSLLLNYATFFAPGLRTGDVAALDDQGAGCVPRR